jgi:hypothetical protein
MNRQFDPASGHGRYSLSHTDNGITKTRQMSWLTGGNFQFDLHATAASRALQPATADGFTPNSTEQEGNA